LDIACRRSLKIKVDNTEKTERILKNVAKWSNYTIVDHSVLLYDHLDEAGEINRQLVQNGVRVDLLALAGQNLEEYFMELMGEKQNA
jgi:ABC-2 type transport system ATP-binding protein